MAEERWSLERFRGAFWLGLAKLAGALEVVNCRFRGSTRLSLHIVSYNARSGLHG